MKIKSFVVVIMVLLGLFVPSMANGQADAIESNCKGYFQKPFLATNRPYRALVTGDEVAEFRATLFSGTTYRIVAGNVDPDKRYVIFSVYDNERNLLFTNSEYDNAPYWDFAVDGYMDCIVEARLDESVTHSGFVILMTGIKLNDMQ
ncbi:MAG: hypothetical protein MJZ18_09810 [Bacteroidales bacterium]|nr:hypothetical protein [Bacteroidales bacterium]